MSRVTNVCQIAAIVFSLHYTGTNVYTIKHSACPVTKKAPIISTITSLGLEVSYRVFQKRRGKSKGMSNLVIAD